MERKISLSLYVSAFMISAAIFIIGIYVGTLLDKGDVESLSSDVSSLSRQLATVQLLLLAEENSSAFCPVYASELASIEEKRERVGYQLSYLEDRRNIDTADLKKEYFVLEAQAFFLAKKLKDTCGDDSVLVLYFYSNQNCSDCIQQGIDILAARDELPGIAMRIYSFDGELESPIADAFMQQYNISEYPSTVIDGRVYSGLIPKDEIVEEIAG